MKKQRRIFSFVSAYILQLLYQINVLCLISANTNTIYLTSLPALNSFSGLMKDNSPKAFSAISIIP